MTPATRVLLVDDEESIRFGICTYLADRGFDVAEAATCGAAEEAVAARPPDVILLDFNLPDGTALTLLPRLAAIAPEVPVVVLTGHGTIERAVETMKLGAEQFLTKPVSMEVLAALLTRLVERRRRDRRQRAGDVRTGRTRLDPFAGTSRVIRSLAVEAAAVAGAEGPILILGDTGSGKGVLAAWLHGRSRRQSEPFVDLNCAGLNRTFLESELFGHEKGAFTDARQTKPGLLEIADGGTLFLDEIGDTDMDVQAKLLKVLEEKRYRRLGDVRDRTVDVRLIAATHLDLAERVRAAQFREDLYYRINTFPLRMPALRERPEDLPVLAESILDGLQVDLARPRPVLSDDAVAALRSHPWPGNLRELKNTLERAALFAMNGVIEPADLRFLGGPAPAPPTDDPGDSALTLADVEKRHIARILREEQGHVDRAAIRLGVPRSTLYDKIRRFGLSQAGAGRPD